MTEPASAALPAATDCIVIGSGAGGATTARALVKQGYDVVILEEGPDVPTSAFSADVQQMMKLLYRDNGLTPIMSKPNIAFTEGRCVGGSTVINGGLCWRTPEDVLERWRKQHGLTQLTAENLDPIFAQIEADLHVREHNVRDDNQISQKLVAGANTLGWKLEAVKRAQKNCRNSNQCPTGCRNDAKQGMQITYVREARAAGARLQAQCRVEKIMVDGDRAQAVAGRLGSAGEKFQIAAKAIFCCGGTMQTPHLLKKSGITHHVGRSLQLHFNAKVVAEFPDDIQPHVGTMMTAQVKEFSDRGISMGGSNFSPAYLALTLAPHGNAVITAVMERWRHMGIYLAQVQCSQHGRVRSIPGVDRPLPAYDIQRADELNLYFSLQHLGRLLFAAGAVRIYLPVRGSQPLQNEGELQQYLDHGFRVRDMDLISVHAMSSCPMGGRPESSATDACGRVHGLRNLYIQDASILPSATGVNPQISIMGVVQRNMQEILFNKGQFI